jgi:hypothetical protein
MGKGGREYPISNKKFPMAIKHQIQDVKSVREGPETVPHAGRDSEQNRSRTRQGLEFRPAFVTVLWMQMCKIAIDPETITQHLSKELES